MEKKIKSPYFNSRHWKGQQRDHRLRLATSPFSHRGKLPELSEEWTQSSQQCSLLVLPYLRQSRQSFVSETAEDQDAACIGAGHLGPGGPHAMFADIRQTAETLTESTSDASDKTAATLGGNTVALGAGVELEAPRHLLAYRAAWQTGASVTVCIPG